MEGRNPTSIVEKSFVFSNLFGSRASDLFGVAVRGWKQQNRTERYRNQTIRVEPRLKYIVLFKNTHREKAPSNKTPALTKSMNMDIWVVGTSNQLFLKGSYTEAKFSKKTKNKVVTDKTPFFVIGSFCTPHSVCLNF